MEDLTLRLESRLEAAFPQVSHSRLGRRFATTTATWKTLRVYHSYHSLDDAGSCRIIHHEGKPCIHHERRP